MPNPPAIITRTNFHPRLPEPTYRFICLIVLSSQPDDAFYESTRITVGFLCGAYSCECRSCRSARRLDNTPRPVHHHITMRTLSAYSNTFEKALYLLVRLQGYMYVSGAIASDCMMCAIPKQPHTLGQPYPSNKETSTPTVQHCKQRTTTLPTNTSSEFCPQ